jgi:hypothetical protein
MQYDGSTTAKWWMICRSGADRPAAMTLPCGGGRALALFGHEEKAELFLWSLALDGLENGWRIREGQHAEIVSMRHGPHSRAGRVALEPRFRSCRARLTSRSKHGARGYAKPSENC